MMELGIAKTNGDFEYHSEVIEVKPEDIDAFNERAHGWAAKNDLIIVDGRIEIHKLQGYRYHWLLSMYSLLVGDVTEMRLQIGFCDQEFSLYD